MSIIVSGSLAYDKIMNFPGKFSDHILPEKIHVLNVSFAVENLRQNFGGTAGNIAYNLALLQEEPKIFSSAGNDFGVYHDWLAKNKINASNIKIVKDQFTACAHIITDQADNQITGFYFGAMAQSAGEISEEILKRAKMAIVAPGNVDDMVRYPKIYKEKNIPYIFDPGQAITGLNPDQLIECVTGAKALIVNDYEMSLVQQKTGMDKDEIKQKTDIVITTLGDKGSLIETRDNSYEIPVARPDNTSDPTGAGDAYRAGLIKGLIAGWGLERVGRLAATVSVYTVEKYGTQTHEFTWESLQQRFKENFGELG